MNASVRVRRARRLRERLGTQIVFGGVTYSVIAKKVGDVLAGVRNIPHDVAGAFIASTDPHVFNFSPESFVPYTAVNSPQEGNVLTWHGLNYLVTNVTYDDIGADTLSLAVYAYRHIV